MTSPDGSPLDDLIDGGSMDCGSGLLLLITRAIRRLPPGGLLGVRSSEPSVRVDLPVWANLTDAALVADLEDWTAAVIDELDPHTPRESYQNFPSRAIEDWPEQYFAENLGRLREVKAAWDPRGVFSSAQGLEAKAR